MQRITESQDIEKQFTKQLLDTDPHIAPSNPFEKIKFFKRILFFWINPLLRKAQKRPLVQDDIFQLHNKDKSQYNFEKFDSAYEEVRNDPKITNKIRTTFYRIYKKEIIIVVILYFFNLSSNFLKLASTQTLFQAFSSNDRGKSFDPLALGIMLQVCVYVFQSIIKSNYNFYYSQLTVRMTGALSMKIFQKSFAFPMQRNQFYKIGDILNMIQVDILQIVSYIQNLFTLLFVFPFIAVLIYFIQDQIQNTSIILVMLGTVISFYIISLFFGKWYGSIQKKFMHEKDLRMRSLEEMMRGIKTIKYNSLEDFFDERIKQKREKEIKQLRLQNILQCVTNFISNFSSTLLIFIVTMAFGITSLGEFLLISESYSIILEFLNVIPVSVQGIVVGANSMKRIDNFLLESFIYQYSVTDTPQDKSANLKKSVVIVKNANFSWKNSLNFNALQDSVKLSKKERKSLSSLNQDNAFCVKNLNLQIKKGEYVVIYGDLGSGKTSILQGILGEMEVEGGENAFKQMVSIKGSISLCTQEPWIVQDTVKENIVYGQYFDQFRYNSVLQVCCLEEDISYFVDGDQTNIGEKGDTLSGGQRKRVNLARTIYKDADIYILDDPLSALDIGVAAQIAKECFEGILKSKTRIVFTNNLVGMDKADRVLIVKNGQIINEGKFNQIKRIIASVENKNFNDEQDKIDYEQERFQSEQILRSKNNKFQKDGKNNQSNYTKKLIQAEDIQQGYIKLEIFVEFIKNLGGIPIFIVFAIVFGAYFVGGLFTKLIVLNVKSEATKDEQYQIMLQYCLYDAARVLFVLLYEVLIVLRMISLSRFLHKSIVFRLLRASFTKFYNLITTGRLMNRLSKDIYEIDMLISKDLAQIVFNFGQIIVSLTTMFIICDMKTIPISIVYFFLSIFLATYFLKAKRQVVRIEATSKSPILQYFSEIIRGLTYLRNCVEFKQLNDNFQEYVDIDLRNQIAVNGIQFWFECITSFLSMFPILISLIIVYFSTSISQNVAISSINLISNISINFFSIAQYWIAYETHLVNYERCLKLKQSIVPENYKIQERNHSVQNNQSHQSSLAEEDDIEQNQIILKNKEDSIVFDSSKLSISFKNSDFQYRTDLPNCLSNISLKFQGNEKIGIVGRTGAGKTSITLALTRIIDLVKGDVLINGKSVQEYSLKELRNTISVVSQEPYIFEGNLKNNLDPYGLHSNQEIINVYTKCGFSSCHSFQQGLNTEITQLGDNLSEGEKQLISIGRIILRKSKIIIVDEPTSHIDSSMEEHVTNILNESFKDCLMITIAHKIKTIMSSDKILVLDHGQVQEFDHPQKLLSNENSLFSGILNLINQNAIN